MSVSSLSIDLIPIRQNGLEEKAEPWEAVFLPVAQFPVPEEKMLPVRRLWGACRTAFLNSGELPSEVFLQTTHLGKLGSTRLVEHAREWMPDLGLGVWPEREPPRLPTRADFQDLGPGEKRPPVLYQVMQIGGGAPTKQTALAAMLGTGSALEIVTPDGGEDFLKRSRAFLLSPIKEPGFRGYPFYVPIIGLKVAESAPPKRLDTWLCGASAYIRECVEDNGILIVSKAPITPVLEKLGGEFLRDPEPLWRIPIPS